MFIAVSLGVIIECPAVYAQTDMTGNLVSFIEGIRNGMPGMGSNGFVVPTNDQLTAFGSVLSDLKSQNYSAIQTQVTPYSYQFTRFCDTVSRETLYVLKENIPVQRGWGTYIFNPHASQNLAIEAPHPVWDTKSWRLAIMSFVRLDARWFIMAGTHRYANSDSSSDMAHVTRSVFYRAHQIASTDRAIQIHGFNNSDPSYNGYPDIVISSGNVYPPNILFTLKSNFISQGFSAGVYSLATQSSLSLLAATTNKEGQWSNANDKSFVHIESDTPIRTDSMKTLKALDALAATFLPVSGSNEPNVPDERSFVLFPNYPNPFNPVTTITFTTRVYGFVSLKVYDLLGKEVATVVNEKLTPGFHSKTFDASAFMSVSSVFFYKLSVEGRSDVKKMVIIK
jgi:hypothetical protein